MWERLKNKRKNERKEGNEGNEKGGQQVIQVIHSNSWRLNKDHLIFTHGLSHGNRRVWLSSLPSQCIRVSPSPSLYLKGSQVERTKCRRKTSPMVIHHTTGHSLPMPSMDNGINLISRAVLAQNCACGERHSLLKDLPIDNVYFGSFLLSVSANHPITGTFSVPERHLTL